MDRVVSLRTVAVGTTLGVLYGAASGCFIFSRGQPARESAFRVPAGEFALSVTNHNYLDVVIYILHDGQRSRVGTVTGSSSQLFYVPVRLLGMGHDLQLLGDAIGSPDFARTETLIIRPGQYVQWTLETDLRRSSVGVF
jgi:hypothetical protein